LEHDDEDSDIKHNDASTENELDDDNSSASVGVNDTTIGVDSNTSKTSEPRDSKVKVEESFVVRDNKGIDKYVKKNNKLNEDEIMERDHYRKTINYLLNKKVTAEKELIKLTTVHSVDINAKAMKHFIK
jgi:hypothetical protein